MCHEMYTIILLVTGTINVFNWYFVATIDYKIRKLHDNDI